MKYQVIYREATGSKWHVFGGEKTREQASKLAANVKQDRPQWTVNYKLVDANFPGI